MIGKELKKNNKGSYVIVPNVGAIAREMTGSSQVVIILKRFLALSFKNKTVLILNNLVFFPKLLKMDYAVGIKLLCELEILKNREQTGKAKLFVLHSQMVDMALALNNKKVIDYFFILSKKYSFAPGLMTSNLAFFIKFVSYLKDLPESLVVFTNICDQKNFMVDYLKISQIEFSNI